MDKYRFPKLCMDSIIIWFAWQVADRDTCSRSIQMFSAVWEVLQGVKLAPWVHWWIVCVPVHPNDEVGNLHQYGLVSRIHISYSYYGIGLGIRILLYCLPLQWWYGVLHYCLHPSCGS